MESREKERKMAPLRRAAAVAAAVDESGGRDMWPLFVKLGVGLALAVGGYLATQLRPRRRRPPDLTGCEAENGGRPLVAASGGLKDEIFSPKNEEEMAKVFNSTSMATTTTTTTTMMGLSPNQNISRDDEGFLLPDFDEFVMKEFEPAEVDPESKPTIHTSKSLESIDHEALLQDITHLRDLVNAYEERDRSLETQLIEYYGLKEQETAVRELENRLKVSTVEIQLLSLKIDSLQEENKKLKDQLSDYSRVKIELKAANENIEMLEKKLKTNGEQAKEKIAELLKSITMLRERELSDGENVLQKAKTLKDLEDEIADLRRKNLQLTQDNSDLVKKLESSEMLASSSSKNQAEAVEEADRMRELNDELRKDIEQLQTDRCSDIEELVYLKWINACLRYELRNYQPLPGKTVARDLSKCLSPNSEEKAKQLILEYADGDLMEPNMNVLDFDSDCCSSSQASNGDCDDSLIDNATRKTSRSGKSKFLSKLKKLVLGTEGYHNKASTVDATSCGGSERKGHISTCSLDDMFRRDSYESSSSCITIEHSDGNQCAGLYSHPDEQQQKRSSLDITSLHVEDKQRLRDRCKSDVGALYFHSRSLRDESSVDSDRKTLVGRGEETDITEKSKLKKFAKALRRSHGKSKSNRRASSLSFS